MHISVLQWNIWYQEDIQHIASFLKKNKADIICLQELTINFTEQKIKNTPDFIAKQLGYSFYHKEIPIESTDGENMVIANGIFSRFPIIKKTSSWTNQPKNSGGYDDEYRAYVEVQLNIGGSKMSVGTTHMSYTHKFEVTENKKLETNKLCKELEKHKTGYIFTGDLNATPGSYTIKSINKILQNVGPDFGQKTWAAKPFSYNGFDETKLNWRLDYIFATKDIKPISSEILQTKYSDHLPILAKLEIN